MALPSSPGSATAALAALALAGCTAAAPSRVTAARLDAGIQVNLAVFDGFSLALAALDLDHADGSTESVTILIASGFKGTLLDGSFSFQGGEVTLPDGGVDRGDLFATYDGTLWGAALGIGIRREKLTNAKGVGIHTGEFTFGLTGFAGEQTTYVIPLWSKEGP